MSTPLENLLSRLNKVRQSGGEWTALCPAHDDKNPSLGIKEADDGTLLIKCHTGCATRDILAAVGLGLPDLYPEHLRKGRKGTGGQPDPEAEKRIAQAKAERAEKRKQELSERVQDAHNSWNHSPSPLSADSAGPGHGVVRDYFRGRHQLILDAAISAGVRVLPTTSKSSYNPNTKRRAPCALWPIRDPRSGDLVGVQREWGRGHKNKRMQGRHIVPIGGADPNTTHSGYVRFPGKRTTLYICEGQVTAAAVAASTGERVVALFDTAGISQPPRPVIQRAIRDGATRIIIASDSGEGGIKAALEGIHVIQTWGLKIPIVWTVPPESVDWADILEKDGAEAVCAALVAGERAIPASEVSAVASATATVWSIQPWRKSAAPVLPCATVPVAEARIILKDGVQMMVAHYIDFLAQIDERNESGSKGRLPLAEPWLFRPTTGTGKTTQIKALIDDAALIAAGGSVLALVSTHDQAMAYEEAGWWHYWGRNPRPDSPGYCPNYKEFMVAVKQHHVPQSEFCHRCPNGLKWAQKTDELLAMGWTPEKIERLEACVWQGHLRDTQVQPFVVAPSDSYSDTLAGWAKDGLDATKERSLRPRLVGVDESIRAAIPIEVGLPDVSLWAERANASLRALEDAQARGDVLYRRHATETIKKINDERLKQITALRAAIDLFKTLATEMGRLVGQEGRITIAPKILDAVQKILDVDDGEVAAWERLEFSKNGKLSMAPLRAAWAIRQTLKFADGHVKGGKLHISGVRPIIDRIGKKPVAFFDATPDPVLIDAVLANHGHIVDVIAQQHVKIIRRPARFWGLKSFGDRATPDERDRVLAQYRALRKLHPDAVLLVHLIVRAFIDPKGEDKLLGHWGSDHRAHDYWAGRGIVIVGSFFPPMDAWRGLYQASRVAALTAGADPFDWPEWPDDLQMEHGAWVNEGSHFVQSRLPLPKDSGIRSWSGRVVRHEAIAKARAANWQGPTFASASIFSTRNRYSHARQHGCIKAGSTPRIRIVGAGDKWHAQSFATGQTFTTRQNTYRARQAIRSWLLRMITSETVQAIGRGRGANVDPSQPISIYVYGGVPLEGLGEYGMQVDEYQTDDQAIGQSRSGKALEARQAISAAQAAGQRTINGIRRWVKDRFNIVVGIDRIRSVMRSLEEAARATGDDIEKVFGAVAKRADEYIHYAENNLEHAISAAMAAKDWPAAELLDIPVQARARPPAAGPPAAA